MQNIARFSPSTSGQHSNSIGARLEQKEVNSRIGGRVRVSGWSGDEDDAVAVEETFLAARDIRPIDTNININNYAQASQQIAPNSSAASIPKKNNNTRRGSSTFSIASLKKRTSSFLFQPFSPSPTSTGSKSSSEETTVTQSSLTSGVSSDTSNSGSSGPASPELLVIDSPPILDPSVGPGLAPATPRVATRNLTRSVNIQKTSTSSTIKIVFSKGTKASKKYRDDNDQEEGYCCCAKQHHVPTSSRSVGSLRSCGSPTSAYCCTSVQAEAQGQSALGLEEYTRTSSILPPDYHIHQSHTDDVARQNSMLKGTDEASTTTFSDSFETAEMKRSHREAGMGNGQAIGDSADVNDMNTLPEGLGDLCLANMGLPFLLFDSFERLVYANETSRDTIPTLIGLFQADPFLDMQSPSKHSHQRAASSGDTHSTGRQKRKYNENSSPSFLLSTTRLASHDVFSHSAFDDIGFATAKLKADPSTRPFSLSGTLQERSIVGESYTDSSTLPPATLPSHTPQSQSQSQSHAEPSTIRKSDSIASLRSSIGAEAGSLSTPGGSHPKRPSRTRTTTDGWIGSKGNQCQPFLRLCGSDVKEWWRSNLSRISLPPDGVGKSEHRYYYAVLLFQPVIHEIVEILPCDDVSSIRSLATPAARPPLNRMPSDPPPVVPDDVNDLLGAIEEDQLPSIPPAFYKAAVECMPQILFTSGRDGIVTYLNPQWYAYTGWDMKTPSREMWADVFHPSDVGVAVDQYSEAIRAGKNIRLQYRVKNKDGQYRWMIARGTCIRDDVTDKINGFVCTLTDGQDLIDAQEKAVQTQQYVSTVLKASAITLIVVDTTRKVVMFEGYTEALDKLGVTSEEAMGRLLEDAWPDLECAEQAQAMFAQQHDTTTIPEREFATTVGPSHFRYRVVPLYEARSTTEASSVYDQPPVARHLTGLAIVCTDISIMVHAEMALVQSQKERAELAAREKAAQEASRLKTIFVTSLSHEIRTPISGMLGISELLLGDETLSPKHRSLVTKQLHAGEVLLQLVSMVLDLGKMEANKLELEREPFLISDLMKDLDIFASLADAKNIYFERILDVREDCPLVGDRLRLAQVLSNFISNSVKFTSQGGITLRVEQQERESDCLMTFQLDDTGPGIDKETLPHLFKPFHQGNVTIARRFGGSGLGLSIAKTLTELMGGSVTLESTVGLGTTARLLVPLPKQQRPLRSSVLGRSVDQESHAMQTGATIPLALQLVDRREDVSILIAEDNALLQEVFRSLVKKMRFGKVRVAEDGLQAIEEIEKEIPHVVLMDIEMPRMNGLDAVRIIRNHAQSSVRSLKIIALTANAVSGDKERFLSLGMNMYLSKPVRASKLEEAILECLQGM